MGLFSCLHYLAYYVIILHSAFCAVVMKLALFYLLLPIFMVLAVIDELIQPLWSKDSPKKLKKWGYILSPILIPINLFLLAFFNFWAELFKD